MRCRKSYFFIFILFISVTSITFADETQKNHEDGTSPFYLMSFFELQELPPAKQKSYLELLAKTPALQNANGSWRIQDQLKKAKDNEETWQALLSKVTTACSLYVNKQSCKKLEDIRLKIFLSGSRKNTDDRNAEKK